MALMKLYHAKMDTSISLIRLGPVFSCRCSNCSDQDRCATTVGCFTIIEYRATGRVRRTSKGCFKNSEQYKRQCTSQNDNKRNVECCEGDMCNDFAISDESNLTVILFKFRQNRYIR